MNKPEIRFVKKSDLEDLVRLCELHAIYEESDYDKSNKKEELSKHLFPRDQHYIV